MARVKICGVTSPEDARACVEAGADAIGINFVPSSPRCVSEARAQEIAAMIPPHVVSVGVFVNLPGDEIARLQGSVGFRCVQLHGDEGPDELARFLPHAYKALRVRGRDVIAEVARFGGEHVLLDAYVPGAAGGTGATFDWSIAAEVARHRKLTLAGGLTPDNVAAAVAAVRPFCVDVASGVESAPGKKDLAKVAAFIARAKAAAVAGSGGPGLQSG
ncbi:MAG TPA: phosphoribosylanthranilate isomerase, partial [Polyangiales bacterium]|nr:phosphoribosylanthranilate isomerase [Polyangiales bacterium]